MLNQPLFAALDVSLETTTICIMSFDGTITKEAVVATKPDSIAICLGDDLTRPKMPEAGPLSEWLVRQLPRASHQPGQNPQVIPDGPEESGGTASRWTSCCDAVLEIGCPAPHPTASCDDLSIDHERSMTPASTPQT